MPKALNRSAKLSKFNYILISHDDFYYCPNWDVSLLEELKLINHNNFYLSGTMVGEGQVEFDAGKTIEDFNENKLLKNLKKFKPIISKEQQNVLVLFTKKFGRVGGGVRNFTHWWR